MIPKLMDRIRMWLGLPPHLDPEELQKIQERSARFLAAATERRRSGMMDSLLALTQRKGSQGSITQAVGSSEVRRARIAS